MDRLTVLSVSPTLSYFVTELLGTDLHRLLTSRPLDDQFIQYFLYQMLVSSSASHPNPIAPAETSFLLLFLRSFSEDSSTFTRQESSTETSSRPTSSSTRTAISRSVNNIFQSLAERTELTQPVLSARPDL